MRQNRTVGTLAVAGLSLFLAACSSVAAVDPLPTVTVEALDVPASMAQKQPWVSVRGEALPATGDLPFAFGGSVIEPGKPAIPAVWLSDDGKEWRRAIVDSSPAGSFSGRLAGSATLAAMGGTQWKDRALTSKLWLSKDRELWESVDLPEDFAARFRITTLSVIGQRVFVIGEAADGAVSGLIVANSKAETLALPAPNEGELLFPLALAGNANDLVLLAEPGPEGEPVPTVAFHSKDSGSSWSAPSEIAGATSDVAGVVWTGSEFVATGSAPGSDAQGASLRARAWNSADGRTWTAEAVPDPPSDGPFYLYDSADAWLGAPTQAGGRVAVVAGNENSAVSALYERSQGGAWSFAGVTSANDESGGGGTAIPLPEGGAVAVLGSSGFLRTGVFSGGRFVDGTRISSREFLDRVSDFFPGRDRELIALSRSTYTVSETLGWRNASQWGLAEFSGGDAVTATAWEPEDVSSLLGIVLAADASGAEVVIGSDFPTSGSVLIPRGYFRDAAETEWVPVSGFPSTGATEFWRVISTGDTWVAVGEYRPSTIAGTSAHGTVWTSGDGIAWSPAEGNFGEGPLRSATSDVCAFPDGTPIAVGWVEESTGSYRMAAWAPSGDAWTRVDLGPSGDREGYASSCASDDRGVVVSATVGGRSVLLHTTDGSSWDRVFTADRGLYLSDPVAVPGGFAASGSWSNDTTAGAVVWLSRDGVDWEPVAVPSQNQGSTGLLAAYGGDLLVSMSATSGNPLLVIRDVEAAIDDLVPK